MADIGGGLLLLCDEKFCSDLPWNDARRESRRCFARFEKWRRPEVALRGDIIPSRSWRERAAQLTISPRTNIFINRARDGSVERRRGARSSARRNERRILSSNTRREKRRRVARSIQSAPATFATAIVAALASETPSRTNKGKLFLLGGKAKRRKRRAATTARNILPEGSLSAWKENREARWRAWPAREAENGRHHKLARHRRSPSICNNIRYRQKNIMKTVYHQ